LAINRPTIIGLGELVWDCFPTGRRLGGAPSNVVYHLALLGNHTALATCVGQDELGDAALQQLADEESPTFQRINLSLQEISRAARALRRLAESLEQQPEAVFRGKRSGEER